MMEEFGIIGCHIEKNIMFKHFFYLAVICVWGLTNNVFAVEPNLIAYWNFDEPCGVAVDYGSARTRDAALLGGASRVAGMAGYGNALVLDGNNDCAEYSNDGAEWSDELTICMWIYPDPPHDTSGYDYGGIICRILGNFDEKLMVSNSGAVDGTIFVEDSGRKESSSENNIVPSRLWSHIALIYDGHEVFYYINGIKYNSMSRAASGKVVTSIQNGFIGRGNSRFYSFKGMIDEIRIYDRALSKDEILRFNGVDIGCAYNPYSTDGQENVGTFPQLSWWPGDYTGWQEIYFGTDKTEMETANSLLAIGTVRKDPNNIFGPDSNERFSYDSGILDSNTTYYWRVDSVNDVCAPNLWQGKTWSFKVIESLMVDNFNSYHGVLTDKWSSQGGGSISLDGYWSVQDVFEQSDLFVSGQEGYPVYRVLIAVVTNAGTILAFCDAKDGVSDASPADIVLKRSTDNGNHGAL